MRSFDPILFIFILLPAYPASMLTPTLNRLTLNKMNSAKNQPLLPAITCAITGIFLWRVNGEQTQPSITILDCQRRWWHHMIEFAGGLAQWKSIELQIPSSNLGTSNHRTFSSAV